MMTKKIVKMNIIFHPSKNYRCSQIALKPPIATTRVKPPTLRTHGSIRNMSITPGKVEKLKHVHNKFNSSITFSPSVTKCFSYVIR